jgi:heme-degrading monooxygenase HmoA
MLCLLSARRLKPGSWDQFRRAWEPPSGDHPPGLVRVYHVRNVRDEDEVISFGLFDASLDEFRAWRGDHEQDEEKRTDELSGFVENTYVEGIYEVIEELDDSDLRSAS